MKTTNKSIHKSLLKVDPSYQRPVMPLTTRTMAKKWDPLLVHALSDGSGCERRAVRRQSPFGAPRDQP